MDGLDGVVLGPPSIEVEPRYLRLGEAACASLVVTGYPREVGPGWLEPLLTYPGRVDVAVHLDPVPPEVAAVRLRRQLARLQASALADHERGRVPDFGGQAATDDAHELAARLARGQGRLFRVGLYLTVHAPSPAELDAEVARVRAVAAALLMDAKPATFRSLQGWVTTLPLGLDQLNVRRTFDTRALAAGFPFASPDLNPALGEHTVLYGAATGANSLVLWDRFTQDNHNSVILARSGAGKSYLAKLEILRSLYTGIAVCVIDPEGEYTPLADAVGGTSITLGAPDVRLNPFDLPTGSQPPARTHRTQTAQVGSAGAGHRHGGAFGGPGDALIRRALFVHTLVAVLLGQPLTPIERAALDRGIMAAYHQAGVTADPRSWQRPAPLLADLTHDLTRDGDPAAAQLADRLAPFVSGSWRTLFDGPTTTRPDGHLIVFSLRDLPEELKPAGILLTLDAIWQHVTHPARRVPRLVVVDEGWLLMRQPEGARFLYRLAKSARKHRAGLTVITQDAADVLSSDLGRAVVANAATQILLRQAPQALDQITAAFGLTDGERQVLATAPRGHGLLVAGTDRVAFTVISSPTEHTLATGLETRHATEASPDPAGAGSYAPAYAPDPRQDTSASVPGWDAADGSLW